MSVTYVWMVVSFKKFVDVSLRDVCVSMCLSVCLPVSESAFLCVSISLCLSAGVRERQSVFLCLCMRLSPHICLSVSE